MTEPKPSQIWRNLAVTVILALGGMMAFASPRGWTLQDYDAPLHFTAFAIITLLTVVVYSRVALSHIFVGLAILGGVTELLQFTPGVSRTPSWSDFTFNVFGIFSMLAVVALLRRRSPR